MGKDNPILQLDTLEASALQELESINSAAELESWRVLYLGKKGALTGTLRGLGTLPLEERKAVGTRANELKLLLEENYRQKEQSLQEIRLAEHTRAAGLDITLPGRPYPAGRLHPITQTLNEISIIFTSMGFQILGMAVYS
ncbi:hypothetical protein ACFLV1_01380 [Chloroflexota bacterium]